MISPAQYFGAKPHSPEHVATADDLLTRVNALVDDAVLVGKFKRRVDPDTGTEISGSKGGQGDGGFRLPTATTGKGNSSHKEAKGVDQFDPTDTLDAWLDSFDEDEGRKNSKLEEYGLYREAPSSTPGWCHLTTRAPGSAKRTFIP